VPRIVIALAICCLTFTSRAVAVENAFLRGEVDFELTERESQIAPQFHLDSHRFTYEMRRIDELQRLEVWDVQFPSPVVTDVAVNNTVHCEFFLPVDGTEGTRPAVVVLHILGGDFPLSRLFCTALAQKGVAALFVKMPYYGPRRDPQVPRRMISDKPEETVAGMTQAILDIRRATAWLAARSDIDQDQLGVFGISLGGITGALASTAEPRLQKVCLLLAGGDIARVVWQSPELDDLRRGWEQSGKSRDDFTKLMQTIDPVTYAENVRGKHILMLNAKEDEVIPRECTESLWKAFGEPEIQWYPGGHYTVARHLPSAVERVRSFFATVK
jgi:dienelactone hydrolase